MSTSNVVMMSASSRHEHLANAFRDHHRRVFKAAFRITGSASDAEDILQSVFLRILKRGDRLLQVSPVGVAEPPVERVGIRLSVEGGQEGIQVAKPVDRGEGQVGRKGFSRIAQPGPRVGGCRGKPVLHLRDDLSY